MTNHRLGWIPVPSQASHTPSRHGDCHTLDWAPAEESSGFLLTGWERAVGFFFPPPPTSFSLKAAGPYPQPLPGQYGIFCLSEGQHSISWVRPGSLGQSVQCPPSPGLHGPWDPRDGGGAGTGSSLFCSCHMGTSPGSWHQGRPSTRHIPKELARPLTAPLGPEAASQPCPGPAEACGWGVLGQGLCWAFLPPPPLAPAAALWLLSTPGGWERSSGPKPASTFPQGPPLTLVISACPPLAPIPPHLLPVLRCPRVPQGQGTAPSPRHGPNAMGILPTRAEGHEASAARTHLSLGVRAGSAPGKDPHRKLGPDPSQEQDRGRWPKDVSSLAHHFPP